MSSGLELKELAKGLNLLYVEDEQMVREPLAHALSFMFKEVYQAENGQEGLSKFNTYNPDIVITDIQMPVMDGLEMVRQIRLVNKSVHILVVTAYSDEKYFMESIELGIDRYILKPFKQESLTNAIFLAAKQINDAKVAEEYTKKIAQEKINSTAAHIISSLADAYPNPVIIVSQGKPVFINDAFSEMMPPEMLSEICNGKLSLDELIQTSETRDSHQADGRQKSLMHVKRDKGKKIYSVDKKEIFLEGETGASTIYTFADITLIEYQRIKLKNYSEQLQELLLSKHKSHTAQLRAQVLADEKVTEPAEAKALIDEGERQILRKSRTDKVSAEAYIDEVGSDIIDEMEELTELEVEIGDLISSMDEEENGVSIELIQKISAKIKHYSIAMKPLFEFADIVFAIESFCAFLMGIKEHELDEKSTKKLLMYLSNIRLDLIAWRKSIFIDKTARDIHYLDSSLFSSCLQAQMSFGKGDASAGSDEDDLELF